MRVLPIAAALVAAPAFAAPVVLDGEFDDWQGREVAFEIIDPAGDASGKFDVLGLRGAAEGDTLYLELTLAEPLNLQSGPGDDGTLVLDVYLADGRTLSIDFRGRSAMFEGVLVPWSAIRFEALPTYASARQEMRIDLGGIVTEFAGEATISVRGSDDVAPATTSLAPAEDRPTPTMRPDAKPAAGEGFRLANMNVLWDGLADDERGPGLARLLRFADADVVTLQEAIARNAQPNLGRGEEPDVDGASARTAATVASRLGGEWNAVADGLGCAVVSRHPLQRVELRDPVRGAAAIVDLNGDGFDAGDPLVVSVHLKCCGYAGNDDDLRRAEQAIALARSLRRDDLDAHPLVVAGDYNLVGSSLPRDVLTGPALSLREAIPLQLGDASATTWRGLDPTESFWPGRLDLILHNAGLAPAQTFSIDTTELPPATLRALRLTPDASLASDHLLLVADFAFSPEN